MAQEKSPASIGKPQSLANFCSLSNRGHFILATTPLQQLEVEKVVLKQEKNVEDSSSICSLGLSRDISV